MAARITEGGGRGGAAGSMGSKANARGLKAANAKVSKNNAGQTGSKLKSDILKNSLTGTYTIQPSGSSENEL